MIAFHFFMKVIKFKVTYKLKTDSHLPKNGFICFNEIPLKKMIFFIFKENKAGRLVLDLFLFFEKAR